MKWTLRVASVHGQKAPVLMVLWKRSYISYLVISIGVFFFESLHYMVPNCLSSDYNIIHFLSSSLMENLN